MSTLKFVNGTQYGTGSEPNLLDQWYHNTTIGLRGVTEVNVKFKRTETSTKTEEGCRSSTEDLTKIREVKVRGTQRRRSKSSRPKE